MKMTETQELLVQYVQNGSESAFRELVSRYINFVYSTAFRLVDGDSHLAEDVTQTVFVHLVRNAEKLLDEPMLGGWLHRDTCFVASKLKRGEQRRQSRERVAALMNSPQDHSEENLEKLTPVLDQAINQLGSEDRNAILLRFYEERDFRSVGAALGSNEDAARMRVKGALQKLHTILSREGVTISATALGTALLSGASVAAPVGLTATVTGAALASVTAATGTTLLHSITMAKINILIPALCAGVAAVILVQSNGQVREKEEQLRLLRNQISRLENERAFNAPVTNLEDKDTDRELLKLRGEIGVMRKQLAEAAQAKALPEGKEPVLSQAEQKNLEDSVRQQYLTRLKITHARNWMLGFHMHAQEHDGQFPTNFSQAAVYIMGGTSNETLLLASNVFDIVYTGSLDELKGKEVVVFMSGPELNNPADPSGGWTKIYAFADGHVQRVDRPDGNFEEWEKEHIVRSATSASGK